MSYGPPLFGSPPPPLPLLPSGPIHFSTDPLSRQVSVALSCMKAQTALSLGVVVASPSGQFSPTLKVVCLSLFLLHPLVLSPFTAAVPQPCP